MKTPPLDKVVISCAQEREQLRKALEAAGGYLLNAKIDLETGCTKATAIRTIEGGLKMIRETLSGQASAEIASL